MFSGDVKAKTLHVSDDLKLPSIFVTSTAVIYGGKRRLLVDMGRGAVCASGMLFGA